MQLENLILAIFRAYQRNRLTLGFKTSSYERMNVECRSILRLVVILFHRYSSLERQLNLQVNITMSNECGNSEIEELLGFFVVFKIKLSCRIWSNFKNEFHSTTVGYQIRLESKVSPTSNLIYTTSGFLLRCLISDSSASWLSRITHIVMDEVMFA